MGQLSEFSWKTRIFLQAYTWRKIHPVPWSPLKKRISESRIALVSSAGFTLPDQVPFDTTAKGGDFSFREIPADVDLSTLTNHHRSQTFDHKGMLEDPDLALPLTRIQEMVQEGRFGELNHRHISLMGSITAPGRFVRQTVPRIVDAFLEDQVDIALLIPV